MKLSSKLVKILLLWSENMVKRNSDKYNEVKMYIANGWELKEETPEFFLLHRNEASGFIHFLLFCMTLGIGNIVYWYFSNKTKKILK